MPAIHQFVAGFTNGDAITNEARIMRQIFRSWGVESEIFSETRRILPELRHEARDLSECAATIQPADIALLHLSIGSVINDAFPSFRCRRAILYHNITPPHYYDLIRKQTAYDLAKGRAQLQALAGVAELNMADSPFNAKEMTDAGYRDVKVLPLVIDFDRLSMPPNRKILRRFGDGSVNVLFVGRCAPNKKIEDAIEAFRWFHRFIEPDSRFIHVGSFSGTEPYYYFLQALARELDLTHIHFAGAVPQADLNAFYRCAHVFLCMSEHEGFCIPVIESMACDLPVMAFAAAAVPDTMDGAGILFREKRYDLIAEMMGRLVKDPEFRSAVIRGQRERVQRYRRRNLAEELRQHMTALLKTP